MEFILYARYPIIMFAVWKTPRFRGNKRGRVEASREIENKIGQLFLDSDVQLMLHQIIFVHNSYILLAAHKFPTYQIFTFLIFHM